MLFFKKTVVPISNVITEIDTIQTWKVEWQSRSGVWNHDVNKECDFFTDENNANHFAEALRNAFKLTKNTSHNEIKVTVSKT
jgi:hypothetical protein